MIKVWNQEEYIIPFSRAISMLGSKTKAVIVALTEYSDKNKLYDYLLVLDVEMIDGSWHRRAAKLSSRSRDDLSLMNRIRAMLKQYLVLKITNPIEVLDNDVETLAEHQRELAEGFVYVESLEDNEVFGDAITH